MRLTALFSFVAASAVVGCTPASTVHTPADRVILDEGERTIRSVSDRGSLGVIPAPVDTVWNAVTSSLRMLKVEPTTMNKAAGEQGNLKFTMYRTFNGRPVSMYFNCGDDPLAGQNADAYTVTASILAKLRPEGNGTSMETILTGTTYKPGGSAARIHCGTTGVLEKHFAEMVASRVN